jgi:hypothetical protein
VKVRGYERLPDRPLVGGRRGKTESAYHALRVYHQRHLEPVDPLGLGSAPPEARLTGKESLARSPHSDDSRHQSRIQNPVGRRRFGNLLGEGPLQSAQLELQGS